SGGGAISGEAEISAHPGPRWNWKGYRSRQGSVIDQRWRRDADLTKRDRREPAGHICRGGCVAGGIAGAAAERVERAGSYRRAAGLPDGVSGAEAMGRVAA